MSTDPFAEFKNGRAVDRLKDAKHRMLPCLPPVWARTGHQQTLLAHLLPSPVVRDAGEELLIPLETPEEQIHSTYLPGRSKTAVYLFHGLGGEADATYMQRSALVAKKLGHHVFINNHRGCGKGAGLASEPYHSGRAEDLSAVIEFGRRKLPGHRHIAIGFSLSANAVLLLAARVRAQVLPDAVIAVNAPIDLDAASRALNRGLNLVYGTSFLRELKSWLSEQQRRITPEERYQVSRAWTVREFDRLFTAPAGGFASREEYYELCSARHYLKRIEIPTVMLTAADDPFIQVKFYEDVTVSDTVVKHIERHGGHLGYLTRKTTPLGSFRWLDYALHEYLMALAQ